ncbi:hypothetical protein [Phaeovulum sp.]|uniref:hypothetical protein n=1 Tax=Phaeovulum sp. TaxID=2934796 RepID=UPI0039E3452D
MPQNAQPLFLARRSYRRRRIMDAAKMLPVLGVVLIMIPALWLPAETVAPDTGRGTVYLFIVWFFLVCAAFGLSWGLGPVIDAEEKAEGDI